ncbi:MAG TPA: hypothetical protein VKY73_10045 [Polyangiaceae bacterium]|nr:hypothetical protein [Polyangiaceae bacterium]
MGPSLLVASAAATEGPDGWIGSWSPGIGDPTFGGWLTVVLYLAAAVVCVALSRSARVPARERTIWLGLAAGLAFLGVNKQLDLQSALTEIGRILAKGQNWYEHRHEVQRFFVEVIALVAVVTALVLAFVIRRMPRPTQLAVVGACLLLGFVVIRAASFHHVDRLIGMEWLGVRANWVLEIGGLACILAAALFRRPRPSPAARSR